MAATKNPSPATNIFKYVDPLTFLRTFNDHNKGGGNNIFNDELMESINLANLAIESILSRNGPTGSKSIECDAETSRHLAYVMHGVYFDMVTATDDIYTLNAGIARKSIQLLIKYALIADKQMLETLLKNVSSKLTDTRVENRATLSTKTALHVTDELLKQSVEKEVVGMPTFIQDLEKLAIYKIVHIDDDWTREERTFLVIKLLPKLKTYSNSIFVEICHEMHRNIASLDSAAHFSWYLCFICTCIEEIMCSANKEILNNEEFSKLLQFGVLSNDTVTKKRSLFLLQKLKVEIGENGSVFTSNFWTSICLIVETLLEKQVHFQVNTVVNLLKSLYFVEIV